MDTAPQGRKRWRPVAILLLVAAAGCFSFAWFGAPTIVDMASRALLEHFIETNAASGVTIVNPVFSSVDVRHFESVTWNGVSCEIKIREHETFPSGQALSLRIERATLRRDGLGERPWILEAEGLEVSFYPVAAPSTRKSTFLKQLSGRSFSIRFPLSLTNPGKAYRQAGEVARAVASLIRSGSCDLPVLFTGTADILVWGEPMEVGLHMVRENASSVLLMDGIDILRIAEGLKMRRVITEAEMNLLSRHPLRAPKLLELRDRASRESRKARADDGDVPEDAYRHVLWSFLLTQTYGPGFAERVTDAREIGDTRNTEGQRRMDLHNNDIGRRYAAAGVVEEDVLERVMTDSGVIRSAD